MNQINFKNTPYPLQMAALATLVVSTLFIWQGNKGFSLWDEGFLWYGTQRVMLGEVPIRDFMSYDPGRYYWSATIMSLWGDNGIMALRASVAIFQAIGLLAGLLLISSAAKKQDFRYLILSAAILVVWMYPRHKLFDISLSILLIAVLTYLIQKPISRRYFFTGLCVGLVAIFGRNHGMYGVVGSIGAILWLKINRVDDPGFIKGFSLWVVGVVAGFAPLIFMALLIPGFAIAFWESITFLFEVKTTNLPLPIPWPWLWLWLVKFFSVPLGEAIRGVLVGLFFIAILVFGVLSLTWVFWQKFQDKKVEPVLVAASFLALPYAHYAYSRADVGHLAHGIFPLLIGCLVLMNTQSDKIKWSLAIMLCGASLWVMHVFHPGWQCYDSKKCVNVEISGSDLLIDPSTANDVGLVRKLADQYAPNGQSFITTPFWPGAYALLECKSPMWAIYTILPRSEEFQAKEIERIRMANPAFILVYDFPLDGRDDLRFRSTHPIINKFIESEFQKADNQTGNSAYLLFTRKR